MAGNEKKTAQAEKKVLVLTVGKGTVDELENTVVTPFRKSFEKGEWALIVLLPSRETEANARLLEERFPQFPLRVRALRKAKEEDNTDACFRHFDAELQRLIEEGWPREAITADVTRGTKAMTAALAMAAMAHRVGLIRYITGERDKRGLVIPGTEEIIDVPPRQALERQDVNLAAEYLRAGNYRAVEALFPGAPKTAYPGHLRDEIQWLAWAAKLWGAWDRFDYKEAQRLGKRQDMPAQPPARLSWVLPGEAQTQVLNILGGRAAPDARDNAGYCRALAADLLANAERRLREGQNEEVLVRLYRVLELMGQMRLFAHGIDSGRVNPEQERVKAWLDALEENERPRPNEENRLELGREKAASLLHFLESRKGNGKDLELAEKLKNLDWLGEWGPAMRNRSILIHGFKAKSREREGELRRLLEEISSLYCGENPENAGMLEACRFPFLTAL